MNNRTLKIISLLLVVILLTGCTFATDDPGNPSGFLMGVWHGIVAPYTLVVRWFIDIEMYAVSNTGFGYDLGFLLGLIAAIPIGWLATIISILFYVLV